MAEQGTRSVYEYLRCWRTDLADQLTIDHVEANEQFMTMSLGAISAFSHGNRHDHQHTVCTL